MSSIIKLSKINKEYPMDGIVVRALNNVDLNIEKGEITAIIGPSGSGKSTLMHIIGLLDTASSGSVSLLGKDISTMSPDDRATLRNKHIGFVFQAFNLLARTTAVDNAELPLIYSGVANGERKRKAIEVLTKVGLEERLYHLPSQLSGGQQQRVAIARALVNNPDLILADEPTGNLDSKSGHEILDLLKNLNKSGNTILLVTHDPHVADYAERIVKIIDGKIVSDTRKKK